MLSQITWTLGTVRFVYEKAAERPHMDYNHACTSRSEVSGSGYRPANDRDLSLNSRQLNWGTSIADGRNQISQGEDWMRA